MHKVSVARRRTHAAIERIGIIQFFTFISGAINER